MSRLASLGKSPGIKACTIPQAFKVQNKVMVVYDGNATATKIGLKDDACQDYGFAISQDLHSVEFSYISTNAAPYTISAEKPEGRHMPLQGYLEVPEMSPRRRFKPLQGYVSGLTNSTPKKIDYDEVIEDIQLKLSETTKLSSKKLDPFVVESTQDVIIEFLGSIFSHISSKTTPANNALESFLFDLLGNFYVQLIEQKKVKIGHFGELKWSHSEITFTPDTDLLKSFTLGP